MAYSYKQLTSAQSNYVDYSSKMTRANDLQKITMQYKYYNTLNNRHPDLQ